MAELLDRIALEKRLVCGCLFFWNDKAACAAAIGHRA
jgi:hypothetical protein